MLKHGRHQLVPPSREAHPRQETLRRGLGPGRQGTASGDLKGKAWKVCGIRGGNLEKTMGEMTLVAR